MDRAGDRERLTAPEVRPLARADVDDAARGMAAALHDDPAWIFVLPDGNSRMRRLVRLFAIAMRGLFLSRGVSTTAGAGGGALWTAPGAHDPTLGEALRLMPPMAIALGGKGTVAGLRLMRAVASHRPKTPHYYLSMLGVAPELQGRGVGARLIGPMLARCDGEGTLAYLESTNPMNHTFYRRQGFVEVGRARLLDAVDIWFFAREPVARP